MKYYIKKYQTPSGSLSPEYLKYQQNKKYPTSTNQGTLTEKRTALDGTMLGNAFDKVYDWSNKNYMGLRGSFARAVDGVRDLYENIRTGGIGFIPGIGDAVDVVSIGDDINKGNYGSAALTAGLMVLPGSAGKIKQVGKKYFSKTGHKKLQKTISKKMSKDDITEELELDKELYPERFNTIQPKQLWWDDFEAPDDYVSKRWQDHEDYLFDNYGEYVDTPTPQSQKVFDQYADAMTRKRDYVWYDLPSYLDNGDLIGIKRNNSVVFGYPSKHTNLFTASHFAPENLREGYDLIKSMGFSKVPIMFAVPPDLSKQLAKANFRKVIEVPQIFNGELIMKDVMINKSVTPEILETEFTNNPKLKSYINNDIIDLIRHRMDNLQFDPIKSSVGDIIYKQGGSIHIKEKNKGKFTESAKRAGKSVQEHARDTVNNPKATKLQKKRAQFALNSKKFKH